MWLLDQLKRFIFHFKNQIFLGIEIVIVILGIYVAYVTVYRYEIIVRATLGLTVHYLLYRAYMLPKRIDNKPIGIQVDFPRDIKLFVIDFFAIVVMIWAGVQVLDMIRYFING